MRLPDIDILIPHLNDPAGLAVSLASVDRCSEGLSTRVVVLDDGSEHDAYEACESTLKDSGLRYLLRRNPENQGRPFTRTKLLALAESPWVAWLDAGDTWAPDKLRHQARTLSQALSEGADPARVWVTCDYHWHWNDGRKFVVTQNTQGDQLRHLLEGKSLRAYLWTLLGTTASMRRIAPFDPELTRLQDLDYFVRFVAAGGRLIKPADEAPLPLCTYEKSDIGRDAREIHRCSTYIQRKHRELYESYGAPFLLDRRVQADLLALRFAKNNRQHWLAARYLASAARKNPRAAIRQLWSKLSF